MFYTDILYFAKEMRSKGNFYIQTVDQCRMMINGIQFIQALLAKGAEHAVSQLDKMVDDFVERRMDG